MRGLLIAAALVGSTASASTELDRALAGRVAGAPVACISLTRIDAPQVIGNTVLLYRDGGRVWRNDLPDACPGLDEDAIVVTEVYGSQLCRGDQFYTLERTGVAGIPGPRCRLGSFVPWDKVTR